MREKTKLNKGFVARMDAKTTRLVASATSETEWGASKRAGPITRLNGLLFCAICQEATFVPHALRKTSGETLSPLSLSLTSDPLHPFPIPEQRFHLHHTPSFKSNHRSNPIEVRQSILSQPLFIPTLVFGDYLPSAIIPSTNTRSRAHSFYQHLTALPLRVCGFEASPHIPLAHTIP